MVDGILYTFRWCPPGKFMMGSRESEWDSARISWKDYDETQHQVKLTKGFWLLETQVTQEMWENVMGSNPSSFKDERNPFEWVSWYDCQDFCQKLSLRLGQQIKLPTEAQWEYACRAGTRSEYAGDLDSMAWYCSNSDNMPHPVGRKKPNRWGLYDMHGNVWEWCSDYYSPYYYFRPPTSDPENTKPSGTRVIRGGGCAAFPEYCRSAYRFGCDYSNFDIGFRILLVPGQEE